MTGDRPIQDFLAEAEDILDTAGSALNSIEDEFSAGRTAPEQVNALFRALHTFKGLSGMFGLHGHAELAHKLEFLLDELRLGKVRLGRQALDVLADTLGMLGRMVQQSGRGEEAEDPGPAVARINAVLQAKPGAEGGPDALDLVEIDPALLQVLTEYEEHRLRENVAERKNLYLVRAGFRLADFEQEIRRLTETLKQHGEIICTLPAAGASPDTINFTLLLGATSPESVVAPALAGSAASFERVRRKDEAAPAEPKPDAGALKSVSNTVRVDIARLDRLMSVVGEMHLIKAEMGRITAELRVMQGFTGLAVDLHKTHRNLERRLNEIQQGILDVRMVPIGQIFTRLVQVVRKYGRDAGKEIELEIAGEETELDKLMIEDLADPLMHLVRNAIDHGIEPPEIRRALDKPAQGLVRLTAFAKGNHVVITVEDDGKGIDPRSILAKAREKGLVDPDRDLSPERDRREILDFIFLPGFTTSAVVTEISGRGVGMDVVKRNLSKLSGMIDIETEPGIGTAFILTLPITLAIIKALIIEVAGQRFAVPLGSVLEILQVAADRIETIETREVMAIRSETVPLLRLSRAFGLPAEPRSEFFVILVGLAERRLGLVVDALQGQQEIVIKPLGKRLADTPGVAGATELGDKRVVLVLDVESLIEGSFRKGAAAVKA